MILSIAYRRLLMVIFCTLGLVNKASGASRSLYVDLLLGADCSAATYSISARNCTGTDGYGFRLPQSAADIAEPGDKITFRAGRYQEAVTTQQQVPILSLQRSGTAESPIWIGPHQNEEVIIDARLPSGTSRHYGLRLGEGADIDYLAGPPPSIVVNKIGHAVHNIIVERLIFEHAGNAGLIVQGGSGPDNIVTTDIVVKDCIARYNSRGIFTEYAVERVHFDRIEAYSNTRTGIGFSNLEPRMIHAIEPLDKRSAARYSKITSALIYNNNHMRLPGNTDGVILAAAYRSSISDTISFGNGDDGIDIYSSLECTFRNNIAFNHFSGLEMGSLSECLLARPEITSSIVDTAGLTHCWASASNFSTARNRYSAYIQCIDRFITGGTVTAGSCIGNGCGLKYSAGGGGKHNLIGNIAFNNASFGFEGSRPSNRVTPYYSSILYNNSSAFSNVGFFLGSDYDSAAGWDSTIFRNNIAFANVNSEIRPSLEDCTTVGCPKGDHNLTGQVATNALHNFSILSDPGIDTNFGLNWSFDQKRNHIIWQVYQSLQPKSGGAANDQGIFEPSIHCTAPGKQIVDDNCHHWLGAAPDIGSCELGVLILTPPANLRTIY